MYMRNYVNEWEIKYPFQLILFSWRRLSRNEYYRHPILRHCPPQEYYNCFESLGLSHVFPCSEEWFLTCRGCMQAQAFCVDPGNTNGRILYPWWPFSLCNRNAGLILFPRSFWFLLDITKKKKFNPQVSFET